VVAAYAAYYAAQALPVSDREDAPIHAVKLIFEANDGFKRQERFLRQSLK
jgi:hypothetical protein